MTTSAKDFLIENLNRISVLFPEVNIRYEYRSSTNSHIIEVIPLSVFKNNDNYIIAEINLEESFEEQFPNEDLVFISEDSLTTINNAEFAFGNNLMSFDVSFVESNNITGSFDETFNDVSVSWALAA
jgi:hypothetical protein